jgi:hypothetical protein
MQKVSFQGPEEFTDMGECDKNLWVVEKMSRYQQWDCLSLVMEFSNEKLKQKGFFHSVDLFDNGLLCADFKQELLIHPCRR